VIIGRKSSNVYIELIQKDCRKSSNIEIPRTEVRDTQGQVQCSLKPEHLWMNMPWSEEIKKVTRTKQRVHRNIGEVLDSGSRNIFFSWIIKSCQPKNVRRNRLLTSIESSDKRWQARVYYRSADKSLARPTSRCILFDG
jgi:hypothetical protein